MNRCSSALLGGLCRQPPMLLQGFIKGSASYGTKTYPRIERDPNGLVTGMVMNVTEEELVRLDTYEGNKYERIKITPLDQAQAWAYVKPED